MKAVFQFAKLVKEDLHGRKGLIRDITEFTGLERHTISAVLHNTAKYISLECVGRLCDYLIHERGVDPAILPGALFGKEQDGFCRMLATRKQIRFCLATRTHSDWPDTEFVMANDASLQGDLTALVSELDEASAEKLDSINPVVAATSAAIAGCQESSHDALCTSVGPVSTAPTELATPNGDVIDIKRTFLDPHHVPAPKRVKRKGQQQWETLTEGKKRAADVYWQFRRQGESTCMFTLGSVKVNGVLEVLASDIFQAPPFRSEDEVACATERSCPFYFRYRQYDPAPDSLCGGTQLSQQDTNTVPGIYYETESGEWKCCPWEKDAHDVAFVLYAYRPPVDELHLACGGFSGLASGFLADRFTSIASQLWEPQYRSPDLEVGLFLVAFDIRKANRGRQGCKPADYKHRVIRIDDEVLARRLQKLPIPKRSPK